MNIDITMVLFLLMYVLLLVLVLEVVKLNKRLNDISTESMTPVEEINLGPLKTEEEIEELLNELKETNQNVADAFENTDQPIVELSDDENQIHLITPEQYMFETNIFEKFELTYYEEDNRLEFMQNNGVPFVVRNVEECIDCGLKFFGFFPGDPDRVYVRNHEFCADFKITKVNEVKEDAGV